MKRLIHTIFLFYFFNTIYSQSESTVCSYYKEAMRAKSVSKIDSLIASPNKSDLELISLLEARILARKNLNKKEIQKNTTKGDYIFNQTLSDFDKIIDLRKRLQIDTTNTQIKRFLLLEYVKPYPQYKSDSIMTDKYSTSTEQRGLAIQASAKYNGDLWLGGAVTLSNFNSGTTTIADATGKIIDYSNLGLSAGFFTIGYWRNISSTNESMATLDLINIKGPLYVSATQFGVLNTNNKSHGFYFPEIGVGRWGFHVSYGYIVLFNKGLDFPNRHMANIGYTYTF